jgi:hypothetical protein
VRARELEERLHGELIPAYEQLAVSHQEVSDACALRVKKLRELESGVATGWGDYWRKPSSRCPRPRSGHFLSLAILIAEEVELEWGYHEVTVAEIAGMLGIREATVELVLEELAHRVNLVRVGDRWGVDTT